MAKKRIPFFKRFSRNKKINDSQIMINNDEEIKIKESPALNTATRALRNLSLLVEQNKETYKRSQILLARANKIYKSEFHSGNPYGE
jgi:hypothetical protein